MINGVRASSPDAVDPMIAIALDRGLAPTIRRVILKAASVAFRYIASSALEPPACASYLDSRYLRYFASDSAEPPLVHAHCPRATAHDRPSSSCILMTIQASESAPLTSQRIAHSQISSKSRISLEAHKQPQDGGTRRVA